MAKKETWEEYMERRKREVHCHTCGKKGDPLQFNDYPKAIEKANFEAKMYKEDRWKTLKKLWALHKSRDKEVKDLNRALRKWVRRCRVLEGKPADLFKEQVIEAAFRHIEHVGVISGYSCGSLNDIEYLMSILKPSEYSWLIDTLFSDSNKKYLPDMLLIMGRCDTVPLELQVTIVIKGLQYVDVEVRDNTMNLVEQWESEELLLLLKQHKESEKWLSDYKEQILKDFSEKIMQNQKSLSYECQKVINDNFWELVSDSKPVVIDKLDDPNKY